MNGLFGTSAQLYDFDYQESNAYFQSLVQRYCEIIKSSDNEILELCCGTGRVSLPLAHAGHRITGVDISSSMLERFEDKLSKEDQEVKNRIELIEQDVTKLSINKNDFDIAICPFNSLMMIADSDLQFKAIQQAYNHLKEGGIFIFDLKNPIYCPVNGNPIPTPGPLTKIDSADLRFFDIFSGSECR